jgi:hypothetical protein
VPEESPSARGNGDAGARVAFDYIKGQFFRVIHADGAIGAITPGGLINMAIFSERSAIPRRLVFSLDKTGQPSIPLPNETVTRDSIVREVEVDVHMSLACATAIHAWLGQQIQVLQLALANRPQGTS